ncbi:MAG: hypothetical protein IPI67_40925 [Myxococcales bacterium]|nr:hypothetical protein [Myxococcales bacterium]
MLGQSDSSPTSLDRTERRKLAPRDTLSALSQLLDGVRRDGAFRTLLLADPQGVLVAGAGVFSECEELAAYAPLVARNVANDTVPTRLDVVARKMEVRRLTIDGIEVLLCGEGGEADALRRAAAGCARILGSRNRR